MRRSAIVFAVHATLFVAGGLSLVFIIMPGSFLYEWVYHLSLVAASMTDPRRMLYALAAIANGLAVPGLFLFWKRRKEPEAGWRWHGIAWRAALCAIGIWCLYVFGVLLALNFGPRIGAVAANTVVFYWIVVLFWNLTYAPLAVLAHRIARAAISPTRVPT